MLGEGARRFRRCADGDKREVQRQRLLIAAPLRRVRVLPQLREAARNGFR